MQKASDEPGNYQSGTSQDRFISTHPGEDRDSSDEEDNTQSGVQVPVPIQDEPIDDEPMEQNERDLNTQASIIDNSDTVNSDNENRENDDDPMGENEQ